MRFLLLAILISNLLIIGCNDEESTPTASIAPTITDEETTIPSPPETPTPQPAWDTTIVDSSGPFFVFNVDSRRGKR